MIRKIDIFAAQKAQKNDNIDSLTNFWKYLNIEKLLS